MDEPPLQSTAHPDPAAATESPDSAVLAEDDVLDLDAEFDADEEAWMPAAAWLSGPRGLLLGLGLGVVVTLGASFALGNRKPAAQPAVAAAEQPAGAVGSPQTPAGTEQPVTIATAEVASVSRTIEASGTIEARELVPVQPASTGLRVLRLLADEGQVVQRGQPLAVVDNSILKTQLEQAQAEAWENQQALAELRAGPRREEVAQAIEVVNQAIAGVKRAKADLELSNARFASNQRLAQDGAISQDRLYEVITRARGDEAALDQAKARLAEAQQRLNQLKAGSRREDINQARARLFQSQGKIQQIVQQLNNAQIVAPDPGVVVKRNVTVGDVTANNQPLFQIAAVGKLELHLKLPETQLRTIRPGQPVQAIIDATKRVVNGRVREIDPVVDPQSRQATVKVELAPAPGLRTGMFLRAAIGVSAGRGLAIPAKAVLPQPDGTAIAYRLNPDNTVTARRIEVGKVMADGRVEVRSGIEPGQGVVVKGAAYLKDGDRVRVMPN